MKAGFSILRGAASGGAKACILSPVFCLLYSAARQGGFVLISPIGEYILMESIRGNRIKGGRAGGTAGKSEAVSGGQEGS